MIKKIGIPKEVKKDEGRVSLIPEHIAQFTGLADIFVESGAGLGSGFSDKDYTKAGAKIVDSPTELYGNSDIICKVKEPQEDEIKNGCDYAKCYQKHYKNRCPTRKHFDTEATNRKTYP